jgi:hypothetical protein
MGNEAIEEEIKNGTPSKWNNNITTMQHVTTTLLRLYSNYRRNHTPDLVGSAGIYITRYTRVSKYAGSMRIPIFRLLTLRHCGQLNQRRLAAC